MGTSNSILEELAKQPFFNTLNIMLLVVLLALFLLSRVSLLTTSSPTTAAALLPAIPDPVLFRTFTPTSLLPYNGENGKPIYFGVRGRVIDVSTGRNFYGPGGPYENFAGRDASRGLACGSFDEEMLTKDLEGPLDDLKDLGAEEMESLRGWEGRFDEKYLVIGRLVSVQEKEDMHKRGELVAEEEESGTV